jgi:hypothetical protein
MLLHAGFAKRFWADTFMTATVVYNLSPRLKQSATPHELFWGHRPDLSHVKTFGCKVFCQRLPQERTKLSSWSEEGQFVGWRELLPNSKVFLAGRSVRLLFVSFCLCFVDCAILWT